MKLLSLSLLRQSVASIFFPRRSVTVNFVVSIIFWNNICALLLCYKNNLYLSINGKTKLTVFGNFNLF